MFLYNSTKFIFIIVHEMKQIAFRKYTEILMRPALNKVVALISNILIKYNNLKNWE